MDIIKYIVAFDPKIKKRVKFRVYEDGTAESMVSGYKFKYDPRKGKKK